MIRLIETGVELFDRKHRVIVEHIEGTKPLLGGVGLKVMQYSNLVARLDNQTWIKHRFLEEPLPARMRIQDWVEFMELQPITMSELYDQTLKLCSLDLRERSGS